MYKMVIKNQDIIETSCCIYIPHVLLFSMENKGYVFKLVQKQ